MKISIELLILVVWPVATALILGLLFVDDRIIRHICRREGRQYSILWLFSWYWHWRIFKLSWFSEAKETGYLGHRVTLFVAWTCVVVFMIAIVAGGFIAAPTSLVQR
jgi:hypothetical protein